MTKGTNIRDRMGIVRPARTGEIETMKLLLKKKGIPVPEKDEDVVRLWITRFRLDLDPD